MRKLCSPCLGALWMFMFASVTPSASAHDSLPSFLCAPFFSLRPAFFRSHELSGPPSLRQASIRRSGFHSTLISQITRNLGGYVGPKGGLEPAKYLELLRETSDVLEPKGLKLSWVGAGRDTFTNALAVQLRVAGMKVKGVTLPENATRQQSAESARQLRLLLLRFMTANQHLLQKLEGPEQQLQAAALCFRVEIACFEVQESGQLQMRTYSAAEGVEHKAQLHLCRKGQHFLPAERCGPESGDEALRGLSDEEALALLEQHADNLNLALPAAPGERPLQQGPGDARRGSVSGTVTTQRVAPPTLGAEGIQAADPELGAEVKMSGEERLAVLAKAVAAETGAGLDVAGGVEAGVDLFLALAQALQRAGLPIKSTAAAGYVGTELGMQQASRLARSEVIIFSAAHAAKFDGLASPAKEMAAAASKYRVKVAPCPSRIVLGSVTCDAVQLVCFSVKDGRLSKTVFLPPQGAEPRGEVVIARDRLAFWAPALELPAQSTALVKAGDEVLRGTDRIGRLILNEETQLQDVEGSSANEDTKEEAAEEEEASEEEEAAAEEDGEETVGAYEDEESDEVSAIEVQVRANVLVQVPDGVSVRVPDGSDLEALQAAEVAEPLDAHVVEFNDGRLVSGTPLSEAFSGETTDDDNDDDFVVGESGSDEEGGWAVQGNGDAERKIVWDAKTLSWKVSTGAEQASSGPAAISGGERGAEQRAKSSFLPRFSKFAANAKASPASSQPTSGQPTIADAMQAAKGTGRLAGAQVGRLSGAGPVAEGDGGEEAFRAVEALVSEHGLRVERDGGGGNVYLVVAELMRRAGLEVQGLMFSMYGGDQTGALVGAMSRKARVDAKRVMGQQAEAFAEPGRWPGDHDLVALALAYRLEIHCYTVVYQSDVEHSVYSAGDGVHPRAKLHLCLTNQRFWPLLPKPEPAARQPEPEPEAMPPLPVGLQELTSGPGAKRQVSGKAAPAQPVQGSRSRRTQTALERVWSKYGDGEGPPSGVSRGASAAPSTTSKVAAPKQLNTATVIWLHGFGGTGAEWSELGEVMGLPWVKFVCPTAPGTPLGRWEHSGRAWLDVSESLFRVHANSMNANPAVLARIYSKLQEDTEPLRASTGLVLSLIDKEIKAGIPPGRIVLAGFSQGATVALHAALSCPERVAGVVALSAWHLPCVARGEAEWVKDAAALPVLACHGEEDPVVQCSFAKEMWEQGAGRLQCVDLTACQYSELGHGVAANELTDIRAFLLGALPSQADTQLGKGTPSPAVPRRSQVFGRETKTEDVETETMQALGAFAQAWHDPAREFWQELLSRRHLR